MGKQLFKYGLYLNLGFNVVTILMAIDRFSAINL